MNSCELMKIVLILGQNNLSYNLHDINKEDIQREREEPYTMSVACDAQENLIIFY